MQPGPGAAAAGYLKKQELFSTSSHQSAMIDLLGETDSAPPRRPASPCCNQGYSTLVTLQLHTGPNLLGKCLLSIGCLVSCRHLQFRASRILESNSKSNDSN